MTDLTGGGVAIGENDEVLIEESVISHDVFGDIHVMYVHIYIYIYIYIYNIF